MRWIARRVLNAVMTSFVDTGVTIDEAGRLCLPDGLTPDRVHRFIEHCTRERYPHPRAALHALFRRVGVPPRAVGLLDEIVHDQGDLDLGAIARHGPRLTAALPQLLEIPERFRAFLVEDLALADPASPSLEAAVASARRRAADRLDCAPEWDALLARGDGIAEIARPWRVGLAAA